MSARASRASTSCHAIPRRRVSSLCRIGSIVYSPVSPTDRPHGDLRSDRAEESPADGHDLPVLVEDLHVGNAQASAHLYRPSDSAQGSFADGAEVVDPEGDGGN